MPPGEVQVAAIHDVERAGFPDELVEDVDIMHTAGGDNDDGGKVALESQQGMEFDGGFGAAERGPRKERKAEVNRGGVQRVSRRLEFKAKGFIGVKRGGLLDEDVGEVGKDTPVPLFIGHRQRVAGGGLADASMIEFRAEGRQAGFDVAQTFAPRTSVGRTPARGTVRKWAVCGRGSYRGNGRHTCRTRIWAGSPGVGRRRCDLRS